MGGGHARQHGTGPLAAPVDLVLSPSCSSARRSRGARRSARSPARSSASPTRCAGTGSPCGGADGGSRSSWPKRPDGLGNLTRPRRRRLPEQAPLAPARLQPVDVDRDLEGVRRTPALDRAAQRRHVPVVPSPSRRHVRVGDELVVGGIDVEPAPSRQVRRRPCVRRVRAGQLLAPGRRGASRCSRSRSVRRARRRAGTPPPDGRSPGTPHGGRPNTSSSGVVTEVKPGLVLEVAVDPGRQLDHGLDERPPRGERLLPRTPRAPSDVGTSRDGRPVAAGVTGLGLAVPLEQRAGPTPTAAPRVAREPGRRRPRSSR